VGNQNSNTSYDGVIVFFKYGFFVVIIITLQNIQLDAEVEMKGKHLDRISTENAKLKAKNAQLEEENNNLEKGLKEISSALKEQGIKQMSIIIIDHKSGFCQ